MLYDQDVIELCRMRPDGGSAYPLVDSFTGWLAGLAVRSRQIETENFCQWPRVKFRHFHQWLST